MTFLTKPFISEEIFLHFKRIFIIENKKEALGFLEIEPMFKEGRIVGFYADILRTRNNIHKDQLII